MARSGILENSFSKKAVLWESYKLENRAREANIRVVNAAGNFVGDLMKNPLRIAYEGEVAALKSYGDNLISAGSKSKETVARELHQMRRDLGIKYKDATPPDLRSYIHRMNLADYGDELGPTIDYLRNVKIKSWDDIIESASRPGGRFNRQYLLDKFPNEQSTLIPILDKYLIQ